MKKYKIGDRVRIVNEWTKGCHANPIMDKYRGTVMTIRNIEKTLYGKTCYRMKEDVSEHIDGWYWHEPAIAGLANNDKIVITTNGKETLARLYEGNKVIKSATAKCSPDDTFNFETGAKIAFDRLVENKPVDKWRVVNRPAKVGDYIRLKENSYSFAKKGDIMQVAKAGKDWCDVRNEDHPTPYIRESRDFLWRYLGEEYEVVEPIDTPEEKPKYYNGKVVCVEKDGDLFAYTVGKVYEFKNGRVEIDNHICYPYDKRITTLDEWNDDPHLYCKFIPFVE